MTFQFSQDQFDAINGICDKLLDPGHTGHAVAVLTGSAGTGKTTVVTEILEQMQSKAPTTNFELSATTHRAAAVLKDVVGRPVSTVHSLFKLRPGVDRYGKQLLTKSGICEIPYGSVIIIDESSMLGNQFLTAIAGLVKNRHLKVLFVGDPYQLPPVSDQCHLFDGSLNTYTLTQVHRQAGGNPILDKANEYREFIEGKRQIEPTLETSINAKGEGIHLLPHEDFVTAFVRKYVNYAAGSQVDIPLCTFTNESAINYNSMIRKAAYFLEATIKPFYENELLIANSVVMHGETAVLTNNEVVRVISYNETEYCEIPGYNVIVNGDFSPRTKSNRKMVFVPKTKSGADKILNEYKKIAVKNKSKVDWARFYEVKNALADLRPPFAGTTHKAQGGTFPAVFIDKNNIRKCRDPLTRARLLYVALTRATTNVYINA
jgi:hypothetical protein